MNGICRAVRHTLGFLLLLAPLPAAGLTVTVDPNGTYSFVICRASGDGSDIVQASVTPKPLPFIDSRTATRFSSSATASYDFSDGGFDITIDDHQLQDQLDAYAGSGGVIYFSVDGPASYAISGIYEALNPPETRVDIMIELRDMESDTILYNTGMRSENTGDETLIVGVGGGDTFDFEIGALTGLLEAGREYRFIYNAFLEAPVAPTGSASATGQIHLILAPEPSTSVLVAAGLLALGAGVRLRKPGRWQTWQTGTLVNVHPVHAN